VLYAFDGTWNLDKPGTDRDTNVAWFRRAYDGQVVYWQGVGTRFGAPGRVVGGLTGAGGRERVDEAVQMAVLAQDGPDPVIDVVGFSRGAALALHFVNQLAKLPAPPPVRFLGLWDCVPSFGVAVVDANLGWDLELPDNVAKCYHALALDERRQSFHLHRPDARVEHADQEGRLFEVWFRGVHSDVGGGNINPGLSSIPLAWMFTKAAAAGLPLRPQVVAENATRPDPAAAISPAPWYDLVKNSRRVVRWNDQVHQSVRLVDGCNNPPTGLAVVDDSGGVCGKFAMA
jgi:uncharacterized protein (DUF2235 family)